ncbi:hypothetical protein GZL_00689 [Streptomyces sp. 769]|nr:hypothetical protein GZL_00689 [Streptomyces sp. 769]
MTYRRTPPVGSDPSASVGPRPSITTRHFHEGNRS